MENQDNIYNDGDTVPKSVIESVIYQAKIPMKNLIFNRISIFPT